MSYIAKSLGNGEAVKYLAHKHWIVFVLPVVAFCLSVLFPPALLITIPILFWVWLVRRTTELGVTSRKVVGKWGVISRSTFEQRLEKVDSIQVNQGILGRILGYGTLQVHGSGLSMTPIPRISDPLAFRRRVEEAIEDGRKVKAVA
jgi:Bacterial PH domain